MRTNFYPQHLEHDYERYIFKIVHAVSCQLLSLVRNSVSARHDALYYDADDIDSLIRRLQAGGGPTVSADTIEKRIERHYRLIDSWSRDTTTEHIAQAYVRLNSKQGESVTGRMSPVSKDGEKIYEMWGTTVNLSKHITDEKLASFVRINTQLISDLTAKQKADVAALLKNGYLKGSSKKEIIDSITHSTGVAESKARFWARDQASKFFGEVTRERQTGAGIPGYIWRTVGDPQTRDSHSALEGTYHDWKKPPKVLRANGSLVSVHPGDDFNCRCYAEPAFGEKYAERAYEGPYSIEPPMTVAERRNRAGITPAQWKNTDDFRERIAIDIRQGGIKKEVESAFNDVAKVLNIPPNGYKGRPFSVSMLTKNAPAYTNVRGAFSPRSGHVYLSQANRYHRSTSIHEITHGLFDTVRLGAPKEYDKLMRAVKKTQRYKSVIKFNSYYRSETEIFSRLMEYYIANRSGNGMSDLQEKTHNNIFYWVDDELQDLYTLIDNIFERLGWAK